MSQNVVIGKECYRIEKCNGDPNIGIDKTDTVAHILSIDRFLVFINETGIRLRRDPEAKNILFENGKSIYQKFMSNDEAIMLKQIASSRSTPQSIRNQLEIFNITMAQRFTICVLGLTNPMNNEENIRYKLEKIKNPITLTLIQERLNFYYQNDCILNTDDKGIIERNIRLVDEYLDNLLEEELSDYSNADASKTIIKGIEINLLNDLFTPTSILGFNSTPNLDKNYTGGGMLEIRTDLFKMRLNPISIKFKNQSIDINGNRWFRYQGITAGLDVFTPYLRTFDTITGVSGTDSLVRIFSNDSIWINPWDRPFYSFKFIGRNVYRINMQQNVKINTSLKIGLVGTDAAKGFQSVLHRDVTTGSVTPWGWNTQIANGGRVAFQYEGRVDLLLWSCEDGILRRYRPVKPATNFSAQTEFLIGNTTTALQLGMRYSNRSFESTNGRFFPNTDNKKFVIDAGINCRYVFWNGTLQGFGIVKQKIDEDASSPIDVYVLSKDEVLNLVGYFDVNMGLRVGKAMIYLTSVYHTPEYWIKYSDAQAEYENYLEENLTSEYLGNLHTKRGDFLPGEKQKYGYYYGVLGLNYKF